MPTTPHDRLPDARDGLTRLERIILWVLDQADANAETQRNMPTAMLYGRVLEHIDVGMDEFQATLCRMIGRNQG